MRYSPWDKTIDEEHWLDVLDWREIYWRVVKHLNIVEHSEAEGALKQLRSERREMFAYRKKLPTEDLSYSGKIFDRNTSMRVQTSKSVPRSFERTKPVASLECFQKIACRACADACPENAIDITHLLNEPKIIEDKCTGCGACVAHCPSGAAVMISDDLRAQKAQYHLPDDSSEFWQEGTLVQLLNRKGDTIGSGRVVKSSTYENGMHRVTQIEAPHIHLWEARHFRRMKPDFVNDTISEHSPVLLKRGWVELNGSKRLCPIEVPASIALWQLGVRRFEDALLCHDGGCGMCKVTINGKTVLGCQSTIKEGMKIQFTDKKEEPKEYLCPCKGITKDDFTALRAEGNSFNLCREATGLGNGQCQGRWCMHTQYVAKEFDASKLRPVFEGFENSPWKEMETKDLLTED